jgi:hypothetical protein
VLASQFWVRSADFQSASSVIATVKPSASRRSGLLAFGAEQGKSGLQSGRVAHFCDDFTTDGRMTRISLEQKRTKEEFFVVAFVCSVPIPFRGRRGRRILNL